MMTVKTVNSDDCDKRHSRLWLAFKAGSVILTLFGAIVGWAFLTAERAIGKADEAKTAAEKNKMEIQTSVSFIREGITDIRTKLDKLNDKK